MLNRRLLSLSLLVTALAACATQPHASSLTETIAADPSLHTLSALIAKAGLNETLNAAGPYTVFAPNDAAFAKIPPSALDKLGHNPAELKQLLTYHILPGAMSSEAVVGVKAVKTLNGADVTISRSGTFITIEDGLVQGADLNATNGVVHVIDTVMLPPARK